MANEIEINEIEMNGLLGHTEDIMSSVEKGAQHKEKTDHSAKSGQLLTSPKKTNLCQMLAILVLLLGTIFFAIDRIYMYREGTSNMFERDKKQSQNSKDTEEHKDTTSQQFVPKTTTKSKDKRVENNGDEEENEDLNLTSQQFKPKPPKIAESKNEIANAPAKKELDSVDNPSVINLDQGITIRDTGDGDGDGDPDKNSVNSTNDNSEDGTGTDQGSKETNDENSDNQMTIVDGIDDKDVYCEDLSQYQEWHNTKITLNDGIMYQVVKQMDHDKNAFTYVTTLPLRFGQFPGHYYLTVTDNNDNFSPVLHFSLRG
jgi:hypothetical protein